MDMAERYLQRSTLLLRMLDPDDLGWAVEEHVRAEIRRVLHLEPVATVAPGSLVPIEPMD